MSIKRIFLKLAVALVTFTIGVSVTAVYWLYCVPDVVFPEVAKVDQRFSCFPGLSVRVAKSTAQRQFFPDNEDESYRFIWLRTFHHPVAIRVWRADGQHFMTVKLLSGRGGYDRGTLDVDRTRSLSENDWDAFMMQLERSAYWLMPTEDDRMAMDGAQWIMEGYREGRYHIVDRQSPGSGHYRDACMYLLRQSGLLAEIPANEVY